MEKKIVFIDVDGTLCMDNGYVPESTITACRKARENGHLLYLCTGRSKAEIYDFIMDIGFDGIIGAGGGFVEVGDTMLYHKKVSSESVQHMVDFFNEHNIHFYLESNGGLFASEQLIPTLENMMYGDLANDPAARKQREENPHPFIAGLINDATNLYRDDINKVCFIDSGVPFERIKKEFENEFTVMHCTVPAFGPNSGELVIPDIHKAIAIEELLQHLGMDKEQTLAIGDGNNDIEMLEYVAHGIAMGNATDALKDVADFVTEHVDNDGFYQAFKAYELI